MTDKKTFRKETNALRQHYARVFEKFGETAQGVDWKNDHDANDRYRRIFALLDQKQDLSILDVGCGYGEFYNYLIKHSSLKQYYAGCDIVGDMISVAKERYPKADFFHLDFLEDWPLDKYTDFIIGCGLFTQLVDFEDGAMEDWSNVVIEKMFSIAKKGVIVNFITTDVDFRNTRNFYKNPADVIELSDRLGAAGFKIDHHSSYYEYFVAFYK